MTDVLTAEDALCGHEKGATGFRAQCHSRRHRIHQLLADQGVSVPGAPPKSEALRGATEAFEFVACEPISIVIELENAAVMLFTRGVSRVTGRSVQGMLAHFIRFRDGKIVELREFMDSFHAAEQALGRELIEGL